MNSCFRRCAALFLALAAGSVSVHATTLGSPTRTVLQTSIASTSNLVSVITLTATVTSGGAAVYPGQVVFCDANAPSCSGVAVLGQGSLTPSGTAVLQIRRSAGNYSFNASFLRRLQPSSISQNHLLASTSANVAVTIIAASPAASSTGLSLAAVNGIYNLSSLVVTSGLPVPSGTVTFQDSLANSKAAPATLGSIPVTPGAPAYQYVFSEVGGSGSTNGLGAIVDLNGDGLLDIVYTVYPGNSFGVYLANPDGTYHGLPVVTLPEQIGALVLGDFNGDGKIDIAAFNSYSFGVYPCCSASILIGNGDGTFTPGQELPTADSTAGAITADFNGDGILDLATASRGSVFFSLGNGDGTFTPYKSAGFPGTITAITAADFNGDGYPDIAVTIAPEAGSPSGSISILLTNSNETFSVGQNLLITGVAAGLTTADFNGDGIPDLALSQVTDPHFDTTAVAIFIGNGDGTFSAGSTYPHTGYSGATGIFLADFNGDGITDLLVNGSYYDASKTILLGDNHGNFQQVIDSISHPYFDNFGITAVGDLNGDGVPDILNNDGLVTMLITQPTTTVNLPGVILTGGGIHNLTATYSGDANYLPSTSAPIPVNNTTAPPVFSPRTGGYPVRPTVTLSDATPGAVIYYTINGPNPTTASTLYTGPFSLPGGDSVTVRAFATAPHMADSGVIPATYTTPGFRQTVLSIAPGASVSAGTSVTLSAYVTEDGYALHEGTVSFCNALALRCEGSALLGTAQILAGGNAKLRLRLGVGTYSIRAVFNGTPGSNPPHGTSTSDPEPLTVKGREATYITGTTAAPAGGLYRLSSYLGAFGPQPVAGTLSFQDSLNGAAPVSLGSAALSPASTVTGLTASPLVAIPSIYTISAVGDLNRDGIPDVVFSTFDNPSGPNFLSIAYGRGDGTFNESVKLPAEFEPDQIQIADFNADGIADLVISYRNAGKVVVMLGKSDGTYATGQSFPAGSDTQDLLVADVNGDGILDIVADGVSSRQITTLLGHGDGTFASPIILDIAQEPFSLVTGDFNGDGIPDIATGTVDGTIILLGRGDGTFAAASTLSTGEVSQVATGDFNGDGLADLVVISYPQTSYPSVSVYISNGDGTFRLKATPVESSANLPQPDQLVVADFNGDGKPDVAVEELTYAQNGSVISNVIILLGAGDGTFPRTTSSKQANIPFRTGAADFNGDGLPDLLAVSHNKPGQIGLGVLFDTRVTTGALHNVALAHGAHVITPSYSGSTALAPSTGPPITITVP